MVLADITTALRRNIKTFLRTDRGNMTMIAALTAIPVVGAAGVAIDYARISRVHDEVQTVADGAMLFAASARTLGGTLADKRATRHKLATSYLDTSLSGISDAKILGQSVVAGDTEIRVEVKARVMGSLSNVFNALDQSAEIDNGGGGSVIATPRSYDVTVRSTASWKKLLNYVCLLVLNESSADSLTIQGTADIDSRNCSVQVNSSSSRALYANGTSTLKANQINVWGNYIATGTQFTPQPSVGMPRFLDPLAGKFAADYAATFPSATVRSWPPSGYKGSIHPGRYNGNYRITNGGDVTMEPGVYFVVGGELEVKSGGILRAPNGVTIVFTDANTSSPVTNSNSKLTIQAGGHFTIKAPPSGVFAGLAVAQHPNSIPGTSKTSANNIQGGGTLDLTGILYYPKQILYVTGAGSVAQNSPMFAIVADKVWMEGNGQLSIGQSSDFEAAGLPALPSSGTIDARISLK